MFSPQKLNNHKFVIKLTAVTFEAFTFKYRKMKNNLEIKSRFSQLVFVTPKF